MGMSERGRELLRTGSRHVGIELHESAADQLDSYLRMVEETNRHVNLTRIVGDDAVAGHFLDALSLAQVIDLSAVRRVVDVGTGLGVPGLVLKIAFPHIELLLVDSLQKRVVFLEEVISALGLTGVTAVHARAEDAGRAEMYRERYDLAIARAVARLKLLAELCLPFVRVGGNFAAYKGNLEQDEFLEARDHVRTLGGDEPTVRGASVYSLEASRMIVLATKRGPTPHGFPRSSKALAKERS